MLNKHLGSGIINRTPSVRGAARAAEKAQPGQMSGLRVAGLAAAFGLVMMAVALVASFQTASPSGKSSEKDSTAEVPNCTTRLLGGGRVIGRLMSGTPSPQSIGLVSAHVASAPVQTWQRSDLRDDRHPFSAISAEYRSDSSARLVQYGGGESGGVASRAAGGAGGAAVEWCLNAGTQPRDRFALRGLAHVPNAILC